MRVIWSDLALNDLAHIRNYIGDENPAAASRIAIQLIATADSLEHLPERARPGLEPGTRELVSLWPYIMVYQIDRSVVHILSIRHGARLR